MEREEYFSTDYDNLDALLPSIENYDSFYDSFQNQQFQQQHQQQSSTSYLNSTCNQNVYYSQYYPFCNYNNNCTYEIENGQQQTTNVCWTNNLNYVYNVNTNSNNYYCNTMNNTTNTINNYNSNSQFTIQNASNDAKENIVNDGMLMKHNNLDQMINLINEAESESKSAIIMSLNEQIEQHDEEDEEFNESEFENITIHKKFNKIDKPPEPYADIIVKAILSSSEHSMQLKDIYKYMIEK
jgi:hypothetical protein